MKTMEVFFDYECPYCMHAHGWLEQLMDGREDIQIIWRPTEAHPVPEPGPHSDKVLRALYFAQEQGADLWKVHKSLYDLAQNQRKQMEDSAAVAGQLKDLLDQAALKAALDQGEYKARQRQMNDYAYEQSGVWALPAYRMDGKKLDSQLSVGITKPQLMEFLGDGR